MKKIAAIIKAFIPNEGQYVEAARRRLEVLNTAHQRVHKLEFMEFLKEELKAETKDSIKKSLNLLKSTHEKIHRLWFSEISKAGLKSDGRLRIKQLWKLKSDYLLGDFSSFRAELQEKFKFSRNTQREFLIEDFIETTVTLAKSIDDELHKRGWGHSRRDLLYDYLFAPYNCCNDRPVQDCFEPLKDENGFITYGQLIASDILKKTEAKRQKKRWEVNAETKGLFEELTQLNPPLTWGEVLFYFIEDDDDGIFRREKLNQLFFPPGCRYCLVCDKRFVLSQNNPGYFRCQKCSTKIRQRRTRA